MKIPPQQLPQHLAKQILPLYLVYGDEPLQRGEATDWVRAAAKSAGFAAREVLDVDSGFLWEKFSQAADSLSLFAEKRIIDLRMLSTSPGKSGGKLLAQYAQNPPDDTILLVSCGKLPGSVQKSAWFQALEKIGVVVQVWPLIGPQFLRWLASRSEAHGMQIDQAGIKLLATRVEGNMLAAAQEIDKLFVLYGAGQIDAERILETVADSARFDVFALVDSALQGDAGRVYQILASLRREGVALPVILWALTREIRVLAQICYAVERGNPLEVALRNRKVWEKRKPLLKRALSRCNTQDLRAMLQSGARLDRMIKGRETGDAWDGILSLCMGLVGVEPPRLNAAAR